MNHLKWSLYWRSLFSISMSRAIRSGYRVILNFKIVRVIYLYQVLKALKWSLNGDDNILYQIYMNIKGKNVSPLKSSV